MKRNLKPFSVEIKKSRVQGQRHQLPPRRLFETVHAKAPKIFPKEELQVADEPAAPRRILPCLIEPVWSHSEAAEPARRQRSSGSKARAGQMELDLNATTSEEVKSAPAEASVIREVMSQTDAASVSELGTMPDDEVEPQVSEGAKAKSRKPRNKAPEAVGLGTAPEAVAEREPAPEAEVMTPSPVVTSRKTSHRSLAKRQADAAQLPRHERWKRRLHPASW